MEPTTTELAWAAGIIDGEGHISIRQLRPGTWILEVGVTNTDPRLHARLKEMFGRGYITRSGRNALAKKPCWYWRVASASAEHVLRLVRPYLFVKAAQADIGLASRALIIRKTHKSSHGDRTNEKEQFAWLRDQLSQVRSE